MMNSGIIQHHDYFASWIRKNHLLKKIQKGLGCILLVFLPYDLTGRIVDCGEQLNAAMFARRLNDALLAAKKPSLLNGLVVSYHGFIFEKQMRDFVVQ